MVKNLIDGLNYPYIPGRKESLFDKIISAIFIYPKVVMIKKDFNQPMLTHNEANIMDTFRKSK